MLNNKVLLIVSVIAVLAVISISIYVGTENKKMSPVINAIPNKAAFILETTDFSYLTNKISKNDDVESLLFNLKLTNKFTERLLFVDSLLRTDKIFKKFINQKTVIISAHYLGQNNLDYLFATSFSEKKSMIEEINNAVKKIAGDVTTKKISFAGAEIYNQTFSSEEPELFYTFYEDYFLLSFSEIILQKAIKNINSGATYFSDNNFKALYQKTTNKNDATLYLNYENLFTFFDTKVNNSYKDKIQLLKKFADWSALDIVFKRKELKLTGHTNLKPEMQYLRLFENVNPEESKVLKILPEKTSFFISLNIGTGADFKFKFEDYLGQMRSLNNHQIKLAGFYKQYGLKEDENTLYELTDDEISLFHEDVNKNGKEHLTFVAIRYKEKADIDEFFNAVINTYCKNNNIDPGLYKNNYISNKNDYLILKNPEPEMIEMFYGAIFKNFKANYLTVLKDFIVFGETKQDIEALIDSFEKDKTLKRKSQNFSFIKSLADQSNIFFYIDLFHSKSVLNDVLIHKDFNEDTEQLKTLQGPAIQFISDSYPIYTTIKFSFNSKKQQISETVWEVRLDTIISGKPFIVLNHETQEKEIIIQDIANKIYLIDKTGKILWTRQLDGEIISNIYQIDYYENNKLQLFFNTKNKIYCIDRKGNWLENYPVELKSPATNGLSIFDYDNNRNYRIFIAAKNKKVYLYNKDGKIVDGWVFNQTKSEVKGQINYYKNGDADYITFRDKTNIYILNRRGETRVNPDVNIPLSDKSEIYFNLENQNQKAHFSISGPNGIIYTLFESGKIEKTTIQNFSNDHQYLNVDINNDGVADFVFTDKNVSIAFDGINQKQIFSYSYDEDLISPVISYNFSDDDIRLGTSASDKIYLINNHGRLCQGFPLAGAGLYSITVFDSSNEFSLIVGNKDNYLYKYLIK